MRANLGRTLAVIVACALAFSLMPAWARTVPNDFAIKHIVIVMQENHTFDNYFGTYPGANGINAPAVPQEPLGSGQSVLPFHISRSVIPSDLDHSWTTAHEAYNGGKMNRFVIAARSNLTMGYFDYHQIPYYWDYASQFVLLDNYYSSVMGSSLPNHLYLIAGQAGSLVSNSRFGAINFTSSKIHNSIFEFKSIVDELDANHISWKYYAGGYPYLNNWNPLPAFASFKNNPSRMSNLADTAQFRTDVKSNSLPSVVWIMPETDALSEHPPHDVSQGQHETVALINTIMQSKYWDSTAIFLTWDDYGGWYDHVPPPQIAESDGSVFGYGFRVPCIIISPYARHGFIDHTQADHTSLLKFIETVYSLPPLAVRDASANNLFDAFNFLGTPRPSLILPGPYLPDNYPLRPLLNGSKVPTLLHSEAYQLPNLVIGRVVLRPAQPKLGDMVSVNFTARNIGNATAYGVGASLYLNDTLHFYSLIESSPVFDLNVGQSKALSFDSKIEATEGTHSVIVVADPTNSIAEVQKDNNALIRTFQVLSQSSSLVLEKTTTVTTTLTVTTDANQATNTPTANETVNAATTMASTLALAVVIAIGIVALTRRGKGKGYDRLNGQ